MDLFDLGSFFLANISRVCLQGSMEFTKKASTIDDPFFLYSKNDKLHNK